jgi:hypothetical protein
VLGGRAPRRPDGVEPAQPSLWVDMESFEVVRIDRGDGVKGLVKKLAALGLPTSPMSKTAVSRGTAPARRV